MIPSVQDWFWYAVDLIGDPDVAAVFGLLLALCWCGSFAALLVAADVIPACRWSYLARVSHHGKLAELLQQQGRPTNSTTPRDAPVAQATEPCGAVASTKVMWTSFYTFAACWNLCWWALLVYHSRELPGDSEAGPIPSLLPPAPVTMLVAEVGSCGQHCADLQRVGATCREAAASDSGCCGPCFSESQVMVLPDCCCDCHRCSSR
jgi:hypothetical protein